MDKVGVEFGKFDSGAVDRAENRRRACRSQKRRQRDTRYGTTGASGGPGVCFETVSAKD